MDQKNFARGNWKTFINLKEEKLLLVIRRHPFVVIMPVLFLIALSVFFIFATYVIFQRFILSMPLFIVTSLLFISVTLGITAKLIIDWYFHIYILTTRKILEFRYTPLTSYLVNDIMLDRVFCTEVDYQTNGWMHDLLDMGDVIITFDRPTHQEEFVLRDIQSCSAVGNFLAQQLIDGNPRESIIPIWFQGHSYGKR